MKNTKRILTHRSCFCDIKLLSANVRNFLRVMLIDQRDDTSHWVALKHFLH